MKFVYPSIEAVFDTEMERVNCLVVENQRLLYEILEDLHRQMLGLDGRAVISKDDMPLSAGKSVELLTQFVPFDLNKKSLLQKITAELEKTAVTEAYYAETARLISELETHLYNLAFAYRCDISFPKISIGSVLKASGVEIRGEDSELGEKLVAYMELVTEFEGEKLFILLNLRSFLPDAEIALFYETVLSHGYHVLMLESSVHPLLELEQRKIVDMDLCEIL